SRSIDHPHLHSFPTRRSSDLAAHSADLSTHTHRRHIGAIEQWRSDIGDIKDGEALYALPATRGAQQGGGDLAIVYSCRMRPEIRSEEHTSELQSRENLVCRLL